MNSPKSPEIVDLTSHQLLDAAPDAIVVVDVDGTIVLINRQTELLFGFERDALLGQPVEMLVPVRFREGHPAHRQQFFNSAQFRPMGAGLELYGRRADGSEFPIEISLSPVETQQGKLVASAIRDVTKRKIAADALREARDHAEHATAAKTRFLAAASHDLRQPLQAISMYLAVLTRLLDQPKQKEISDKIFSSLDTMRDLLDALLDISKLEGGSITPEKRDFRLGPMAARIITDNVQQAEQKGLTLVSHCDDCVLHSDPVLLERLVENFVTNAIRYTEHGEITLKAENKGNAVALLVQDTGIGIPEEALDKVFEEYYQLDNPVRDRHKGLGLGLAIVKHIARLLDHPLSVVSVPGSGSTFGVEVPMGDGAATTAPESDPPTGAGPSVNPVILFIDDDDAVADASSMMLEAVGIVVHTAKNGEAALAKVAAGLHPDMVISDYRLPGLNGIEVIRRIRAATAESLHCALITGDTSAREIEAAQLQRCEVLFKPVDGDRLIELIERTVATMQRGD